MQQFKIKPVIDQCETVAEFAREFHIGSEDLIFTSEHTYRAYFEKLQLDCQFLFRGKYGSGEPTDVMAEAIYADMQKIQGIHRIIAIGGGTILDLAKLYALKNPCPIQPLFDGEVFPEKDKELVLVPTTCGTGSEITNISILALTRTNTKKGLASDTLYADVAVLIPELLEDLPGAVFATSSIDALVHGVESALSPKANAFTKMFSYQAIHMIISGYQHIKKYGKDSRKELLKDFLLASAYAGIAFGNAGCAAVHALSYPLGAKYHVAHGESNYAMFAGVMKKYMEISKEGEIAILNAHLAEILSCREDMVYDELEKLLDVLLPKRSLQEYGMTEEEISIFTDSVMENQGRLMANSFVPLTREDVYEIYKSLYKPYKQT